MRLVGKSSSITTNVSQGHHNVFPRVFNRVTKHSGGTYVWQMEICMIASESSKLSHNSESSRTYSFHLSHLNLVLDCEAVVDLPVAWGYCIIESHSPEGPKISLSSGYFGLRATGVSACNICIAGLWASICPLFIRPLSLISSPLRPDLPCIPSD